ncbi:exonuclease domain-containing protein [Mucilaginibacter antarcticus]|uniref:Exonuclease domain-containing protein n=1 Tax=Mucilaginibacter antarcticus TaxID=1855725 RepID=A0ABW5XLJ0_9SPHI
MNLNLKRPLAFFDIEATGMSIGVDRIVEISIIKLHPDGTEDVKTWRVHPEMPIPLETSLIHGIYDEDIATAPKFNEIAPLIAEFLDNSDLAGYNSNKFDIPMLMEEFLRVGVTFDIDNRHFVDVQNIFHQMEQRTLKAAYQFYCQKQIINAHSAEADTRATMEVLLAQIARYENQEWEDKKGNKSTPVVNHVEGLHLFTNLHRPVDFAGRMAFNDAGEEVLNFGKHKGRKVEDVFDSEPSYYSWMMNGDFPLYTKRKLTEIYKRWNNKKITERQSQPAVVSATIAVPKSVDQKPYNKPYDNKSHQKKEEPSAPVNDDMLKLLADKFKKG